MTIRVTERTYLRKHPRTTLLKLHIHLLWGFFLQDNKLGIGPLSWAIYWEQTNELGKDMTQLKLNTWLWCMRIINLLTVYLVRKHFPINHPIGHVEDVLGQFPWWLLIGKQNGLPGDPKTHQYHQHNDDKVHHVYHLERWGSRGRNKKKQTHHSVLLWHWHW